MTKKQPIIRDERFYVIENASYRIGYIILAFGLMLLIFIRSIAFQESNWDLFALVVISSLAATIYQFVHKIISFSWKWIFFLLAVAMLAAMVTYIVASLTK